MTTVLLPLYGAAAGAGVRKLASSVLARLRFLPRLLCVSGPLELAFPSSTLLLVTISRISLPYSSTENLSMVAVVTAAAGKCVLGANTCLD